MAIILKTPFSLNEKGKRKNNQDSIYPFNNSTNIAQNRLFMVCDGVGGANKGEIASRMVCEAISAYFNEHSTDNIDETYISKAIKYAEARLARHTAVHVECAGTSTTLTLLWLDDANNRAVVAWVGDSRVYQIRDGEVAFVTTDHSLVSELVKRGDISPEEASLHPQRNVILRAISDSGQPAKADVVVLDDVQAGDYFMLCTDGILESIDETILEVLLPDANADLGKVQAQIYEMCDNLSNDNFSMYLLNVAELSHSNTAKTNQTAASETLAPIAQSHKTAEVPVSGAVKHSPQTDHKTNTAGNEFINTNKWLYVAGSICAALILVLGVYKMMYANKSNKYAALITQADSLRQAQNYDQAIALYQEAHNLLPDHKDAKVRLAEMQEMLRGKQVEDSLRSVVANILADSLLFKDAGITRMRVEEAQNTLDAAMLSNLQGLLDSLKNHRAAGDTTSVDSLIKQKAQTNSSKEKF
jgi:serine/threonine protein phosphatase PrpC